MAKAKPADPATDPRIDAYIEKAAPFAQPILHHLRARMHAAVPDIGETIKWGMPFFTWRGEPVASMAAFKAHAAFGFWQRSALTTGHEGEAMGQFGQLRSLNDLPDDAVIAGMIAEALSLIASGAKPAARQKAAKPEAPVPPALADALAADDAARATFEAFPPGCRREYCEWIAEAKREETRTKRVAEAIALLREGKKRYWKYENC